MANGTTELKSTLAVTDAATFASTTETTGKALNDISLNGALVANGTGVKSTLVVTDAATFEHY